MTRRKLAMIVVLSTAFAAVGGTIAGRWNSPNQIAKLESQPVLFIDPKDLDFGEVWENDSFEWSFPIANTARHPVRVTRWAASCDCLGITPDSLTLAPGESQRVSIRLDLARKGDQSPIAVSFEAVLSGDLGRQQSTRTTWQVKGSVKPLLTNVPDISLGVTSVEAKPYPSRLVQLNFSAPSCGLSATCNSPFVTARLLESETGRNNSATLELRISPTVPLGNHQYEIALRGQIRSSNSSFRKRFPCEMAAVQDIQLTPMQVVVAGLSPGAMRDETVSFHSVSGRNCTFWV